MTGVPVLWVGGLALVGAVGLLLLLIATGGRTVPLARRRPAADPAKGVISRAADAATHLAGRALGGRAGRLEDALEQAGLRWRPQEFLVMTASGMLALLALGLLVWGPLGGLVLLLAGPLVAWAIVRVSTSRRRKAFALQLDETLSTLAGSLRAGYSLPQACATVASEAMLPTSEEFARVINEARVGRPFVQALEDAAKRLKNDDFYWIVQAIAINREVGGNLADVLEGVGSTIRDRTHLKRQVDALSAEGRLSAIVLGALPILVFVAFSVINPGYMGKFGDSLFGMLMLAGAGLLLVIGLLWLRVLVKIKY